MPKQTLADRVEDHSKKIDRMDTLLAGVVGDVKKIQVAVNGDGNGNIGMGERLRDLQSKLGDIVKIEEDRRAERAKWMYGVTMLFLAQIVSTIIMLGVSAFLWFVRIAPALERLGP